MIPAKNVEIINIYCASMVEVNKRGSCALDVLQMISNSNVVKVSNFCNVLRLQKHVTISCDRSRV